MSRPLSRRPSAAVVPRREQKSSSRAPSTIPAFDTQPERYKLDESEEIPWSVVPNTPNTISGRRHRMQSQNVQTISSTSPSPSQHSVRRSKQTENHQKRQSTIPQAESPGSQSSQSKIKAKQVGTDHLQALDDTPQPELLTALRAAQDDPLELWIPRFEKKGLPRTVVFKEVVQAISHYFPNLKWDQSEPTQTQQSTTGLAQPGATEGNPDLEIHPSAPISNNMRESQHGSNSPQDATDGVLYRGEATSSKLTTLNKKGRSTHTPRVTDLRSVTINNEQEFRKQFRKYGLDKITVREYDINLLELARQTVENVKPRFQERQRKLEEQERQLGREPEEQERQQEHQRRRGRPLVHSERKKVPTGPVNITDEIWQVLFTIIANMFVFGPGPLYDTVKAMSKQSSIDSNEHPRRNRRGSSHAVTGPHAMSQDTLFEYIDKEELDKLVRSVRWWWPKENKSQVQLEKVYVYYEKLETVRLYDALMSSWQEHEEAIQNFVRDSDRVEHDPATCILSCIWQQITPSRQQDTNNTITLLPKNSPKLKLLSGFISAFRPIHSLVDAFGEGALLLLVDKAEKYVPGKVGEGLKHYPQHERIRDVALSLCEVDRIKYDGQLRQLFTDLEENALKPILQHRKGGNSGSLLHDCPRKVSFDRWKVGKRISNILTRISESEHRETGSDTRESADSVSDIITTRGRRARRRLLKRGLPQNSMEGAVDGEQGTSKRQRTESGEDEESRQDGPGSNDDPEEDIYNS